MGREGEKPGEKCLAGQGRQQGGCLSQSCSSLLVTSRVILRVQDPCQDMVAPEEGSSSPLHSSTLPRGQPGWFMAPRALPQGVLAASTPVQAGQGLALLS